MTRAILSTLIIMHAALAPAFAAAENMGQSAFLEYLEQKSGPAYYTIKEFPNQKLIPVRLIGGVSRPGFYQVPEKTTLLTLLSYSGGATASSDLESVTMWRNEKKVSEEVNVMKLMRTTNTAEPTVNANDVVLIKEKQSLFSPNTLATLTVLSAVTAIILTSLLIEDRIKDR